MKLNISLNVKLTHNAIIHSMNQESIHKIFLKVASLIKTVRVGWKWAGEENMGQKKREGGENEAKHVFEWKL